LFRLKGNTVLTKGTDYKELPAGKSGDDSVSKIEIDIASNSAGTYKCRATQFDEFCSQQKQFESEGVVLTIIAAVPKQSPQPATAYGKGKHTFTCKFPNPFVGQTYEIAWSFKGIGESAAMVNIFTII
jgi:hypothetical protein